MSIKFENVVLPSAFCDWIKTLPYPELICGEGIYNKEETLPDCFVTMPGDK